MKHFIFKVPEWNGSIVFCRETVTFILVLTVLLVGLLLCFWGYRYMRTLCIAVLACLTGIAGVRLAQKVTDNTVVQMYVWVLFIFVCTCIFYYLSGLILSLLRKLHSRELLAKRTYLIAALLGAAVVSADIYLAIFRSPLVLVLFVLLLAAGAWHGKKKSALQKVFYTYEDVYQRQILTEKGKGEEHA